MYTLSQKKEISRRIADKRFIPIYRALLEAKRVPSSGMRMADKDALAQCLVITALDKYTEEQISAACRPSDAGPGHLNNEAATVRPTAGGPSGAVKKNAPSSTSTRESTGATLTAPSSGLRIPSIPTGSTAMRVCANWRHALTALLQRARTWLNT